MSPGMCFLHRTSAQTDHQRGGFSPFVHYLSLSLFLSRRLRHGVVGKARRQPTRRQWCTVAPLSPSSSLSRVVWWSGFRAEMPPRIAVSPPVKEKGASASYLLVLFFFFFWLLFCLISQSTKITSPILNVLF